MALCAALDALGRSYCRVDELGTDQAWELRATTVINGGACGQTLDVSPPAEMTWSELLARAGVTSKPVARWRTRLGRWFGARAFDAPMTSPAPAQT